MKEPTVRIEGHSSELSLLCFFLSIFPRILFLALVISDHSRVLTPLALSQDLSQFMPILLSDIEKTDLRRELVFKF